MVVPDPIVTFELEDKQYRTGDPLDINIFSTTYKLKALDDEKNTRPLVMKVPRDTLNHDSRYHLSHEIATLQRLSHDNIIKCLDVVKISHHTCDKDEGMVMERGDLSLGLFIKALRCTNAQIRERWAQIVAYQMLNALEYLDQKLYVHGDVKPANILIFYGEDDESLPTIKLANFGATAKQNACVGWGCGASAYAAPETRRAGPGHLNKSDIYSLGKVLNEMLGGRESRRWWSEWLFPTPASKVIDAMLEEDPTCRRSASELLQEKWVQEGRLDVLAPSEVACEGSLSTKNQVASPIDSAVLVIVMGLSAVGLLYELLQAHLV